LSFVPQLMPTSYLLLKKGRISMSSEFFIWEDDYEEGYCVVKPPLRIAKAYQLGEGKPRSADWPADARCEMDPDFPEDIQLSDSLYGAGLRVISDQLKSFIEREQAKHIEYLPLTIINHKGRVASKDYFILNPTGVIDCIDIQQSNVEWNPIDSKLIDECDQLVIDGDHVPSDRFVFRPKYLPSLILVRKTLADKIKANSFTGVFLKPPSDYIGL
jgi:hypothetical protein